MKKQPDNFQYGDAAESEMLRRAFADMERELGPVDKDRLRQAEKDRRDAARSKDGGVRW